ncbi:MAG: hypothetical protein A4S09_05470 [Proteobacteria bacterium SG_bin7]|nr:MAG: hypothetical protein A4S09_05470 [Proteobacteria bacterium SG_bin7]
MKPMKLKWNTTFIQVLVFIFPFIGNALDFSEKLAKVQDIKDKNAFFNSHGDIDPFVINSTREVVATRRREIFDLLVQQELKQGKSEIEARMKAVEEDEIASLDLILTYLDRLEQIMNNPADILKVKAQIIAQKIVDLSFATQIIGQTPFVLRLGDWAKGVMHKWKLDLNTPIEREAKNLWNENEKRYYSVDELIHLKASGFDLSTLNPPPNSGIWRNPGKISEINVKDFYYANNDFMHYGLKAVLPERNVGTFDKVKISQTTPKIMVKYRGADGKTYKAKMKFGKDLHADITASALFLALGYPADISRYYRDFKIYFKDRAQVTELKRDWLTYFSGMPPMLPAIHIDSVIKSEGKDGGGEYIIFKECVVEADPKGLLRVGPIDFDKRGLQKWRESRAYALLNLWVENTDWDPDNTKLILRRNANNDDYDFFYVVHDLGCAFGGLLCEKIDRFRANVVSSISKSQITFDFRSADNQPMKDEATLADYKWGARLMAQLTRGQITDAVSLGGWPESIQKLLVEKLINRRNEFVKAFGLEGEVLASGETLSEMPVTLKFDTEDGVILNGEIVKPEIDGYATNYGEYWDTLVWKPLVNSISSQVKFGIAKGLCELERVAVEPVWLGWNQGLIAEVLVSACRDVIKNPKPLSEKDIWLVRDTLKVGIRGGAGFVVAGELDLVKKYTLVYGARTEYEGKNGQGTILNVILPFQIKKGNLPERFVLIREDMLVPRVRARSDIVHFTGIGIELLDEQYLLSRSVVADKGDDRIVFYEDTSFHNDVAIKLFANLAISRIPFFRYNQVNYGQMNGRAWILRRSDAAVMKIFNQDLLSKIVRDGDFSQIGAIPQMVPKEIDSKILKAKTWTFNLFGFFQRVRTNRQDTISVREGDYSGADVFKDDYVRKDGYSFFGVREQDQIRVIGYLTQKVGDQSKDPFIAVTMNLRDSNTKSKELDDGFIKFLNGVYPLKQLNFTADLHSSNQRWGSTEMRLYIAYYREALTRLLDMDEAEFVKSFIALEAYDNSKIMQAWRQLYSPDSLVKKGEMRSADIILPGHIVDDLIHLSNFMRAVRMAKSARDIDQIIELNRAIREAIYDDVLGNSYDGSLFAAINSWVGEENLFISREVTAPYDTENRFPGGQGLQWEDVGIDRKPQFAGMILLPEDVLEVWTMFEGA